MNKGKQILQTSKHTLKYTLFEENQPQGTFNTIITLHRY